MESETAVRNVAIPVDLHAQLKTKADKQGMKLRIFVERLLREAVKKGKAA
jgi:predicted HicB family RNase H-like nuclease